MTTGKSKECAAKCVLVLASGETGQKMLYMYPFIRPHNLCYSQPKSEMPASSSLYYSRVENPREKNKPVPTKIMESHEPVLMTEFCLSTDILAQILKVHQDALNRPMDVKIDNFRFVGWPMEWKSKSGSSVHLSVVFAMRGSCEMQSVTAYQKLSKKLAISFITLQGVEWYMDNEQRIMEEYEPDGNLPDPYLALRGKSRLAKTITDVFDDVQRTGCSHRYINDFVEIGFCDETYSLMKQNVMPKGAKEIENITRAIRPYHGILLLEDVWPTPDANSAVAHLLRHCSPDRSILDMATASGIPIFEVFTIVRHLLVWTRAILIYPLCNTNVYTSATSPQPLEKMIEKFASHFGATIHLAAGLAHFNPPATLGSFIRVNLPADEQQVRAKLVVALLRHQMLMQLHQFCYIIKPYSNAECPSPGRHCPESLKNKICNSCLDKSVRGVVADICVQMLQKMTFDEVTEKLDLFISMAPLMDGNHHMEDIKYQTNLTRDVVESVVDAFELVIAKFLRPDFVSE